MPIDIDLLPNGRVSVAIIENQHLDQLTLMMSSLLSSQYEREKRRWTLTWPDFCLLRERMATARLTDGRSATEAAYDWITLQQDIDQSMEEIKDGKHNSRVQGLEILRTKLYEDQVTGVSFLMSRDRAVLADEMGVGKASMHTEPVLTPTGWRKIGDLAVGDRVIDPDGGIAVVLGVYPQGEQETYEVKTSDGESSMCTKEHLWQVNTKARKHRGNPPLVMELQEFMGDLFTYATRGDRTAKWFLPIMQPAEFDSLGSLPLHPYLLGVLLGDGSISGHTVAYTKPDHEILARVTSVLPSDVHIVSRENDTHRISRNEGTPQTNSVLLALRQLGLMGSLSIDKFIPEIYLRAAPSERLELLHGLMDTDGNAQKNGACIFNTSSARLRDDVIELVRSLGGIANAYDYPEPKYVYKGETKTGHDAYRVNVRLPVNPFTLPRKADRWTPPYMARSIVSVTPAGRAECVCIRVSSKRSLYVTRGHIVTHNTIQLLSMFALLKAQGKASHALVVCPNSVKQGWVKEVAKHTKLSVKMLGNKPIETIKEFGLYAQKRTDVLVVHYDAMVAPSRKQKLPTEEEVNGAKPTSGKAAVAPRRAVWSPLVDELLRLPWDVLIYDEAHQLKNTDAKRTQACLHLSDKARTNQKKPSRLYLVTGTPISETPLDAWSILKFLAPELLPGTYSKFENYFSRKELKRIGLSREVQEIVGYRNLSELKVLLQRLMIRRLKIDIKGMPPKVEQVRYLQMTDEQRKLYTDIKKGVYDAVVQDPNDKLSLDFAMTKCLRLRQVLNSPKLVGREGTSVKHAALDELLDELLQDPIAKVVVWTEWRAAIDLLYDRYQKQYGCIKLIGGTSQEDLSYWSKNWDTMSERIAIGIPAFGGTGVDFLSRCRTAIYMEPPYSTIQFRQSMDRIHRRTNTTSTDPIEMLKSSPATLVFMQCENTIDELVFKVLAGKGGIVDAMLVPDEKLVQIGKAELLKYLQ